MRENTSVDMPSTAPVEPPVTNRQFVAMVRAILDAAGHGHVEVDRQWIDQDTRGHPFLMRVPVGAELIVPLTPLDHSFLSLGPTEATMHAEHFAGALVTLKKAESMLVGYARDVRRAASATIAIARAEGLDIVLADVGFRPTCACHLAGSAWKDSAYHVLASVVVRHTSFFLRPTTSEVYVEEPENVADELKDVFEEQRKRQARLAELDALDADLLIDGITLDLLEAHCPDVGQILTEVWKKQHVSIPVEIDGYGTTLSLITWDGRLEASIQVDGAIWNGQYVWFVGDNIENGLDLVGETLAKLRHPTLAARKVVGIDRRPRDLKCSDHYYLEMGPTFLFDADTGITRPMETWPAA